MRRLVFLFIVFCALVGASVADAAPHGGARFIVTRPSTHMARLATVVVEVNGAAVAEIEDGKTVAGALPPGPVTIAAHAKGDIGQTTVKFTAAAGHTYRFVVTPRTDPIITGALFGIAGLIIEGGGSFKIAPAK